MYLYICIVNPGPFQFEAAFFGILFTGRCYFLADLQNDQMSRSTLERKRAREAWSRTWAELVELVQFVNYADLWVGYMVG